MTYFQSLSKKLPWQKWAYNNERAKLEGDLIEKHNQRTYAEAQWRNIADKLQDLWSQYKYTNNQNTKWKIRAEAINLKKIKDRQEKLTSSLKSEETRLKSNLLRFDSRIDVSKLLSEFMLVKGPKYVPNKVYAKRTMPKRKTIRFKRPKRRFKRF